MSIDRDAMLEEERAKRKKKKKHKKKHKKQKGTKESSSRVANDQENKTRKKNQHEEEGDYFTECLTERSESKKKVSWKGSSELIMMKEIDDISYNSGSSDGGQ